MDLRFSGDGPRGNLLNSGSYKSIRLELQSSELYIRESLGQ
jgi:hypothetical protein